MVCRMKVSLLMIIIIKAKIVADMLATKIVGSRSFV
jgi:hypothetical protein